MFCIRVAWVCSVCLLLCKEEDSSPVSLQLLRGGISACMRCPCEYLMLGFSMGTMLVNFHMCGIILLLRAVLNMLVRNACPRRNMCFRCLMFSLSGHFNLLFFTLFYCMLYLFVCVVFLCQWICVFCVLRV